MANAPHARGQSHSLADKIHLPLIFRGEGSKQMMIGDRLHALREEKKLSQGDIESRCGLLRCYLSRVENGHTVPSVGTLEKLARALEVPLYRLFYDGNGTPARSGLSRVEDTTDFKWPSSDQGTRYWNRFSRLLARMEESDRKLLLQIARRMAVR